MIETSAMKRHTLLQIGVFFSFILSLNAAAPSSPTPAANSTGTAMAPQFQMPPAPESDDLSKYKTADALWSHFNQQKQNVAPYLHMAIRPKSNKEDAKKLISQIEATLKLFIAKYPSDQNWWEARMQLIQVGGIEETLRIPTAPTQSALVQEFNQIYNDKKAPNPIRLHAGMGTLFGSIMALARDKDSTPASWKAIDSQIDDFKKKFADEKEIFQSMMSLRTLQLQISQTTDDPKHYQALLQKLASDSQPEVADMAKQQLAQQKVLDDLKNKPVDLKFTAVDGTKVDLAKLRGKIVVLDFWASWCPPCVPQEKEVVALYQKYHKQGVEIVGISYDSKKEDLLAFTKQNGMAWPQYFDGMGWQNKLGAMWGVHGIPSIWLLDKKGKIASTNGRENLAQQVEKLLQTPN